MKVIGQGRSPQIGLAKPIFCRLPPLTIWGFSTDLAPMSQGLPQKKLLLTLEDVTELLIVS
jgi:hypothetical protein